MSAVSFVPSSLPIEHNGNQEISLSFCDQRVKQIASLLKSPPLFGASRKLNEIFHQCASAQEIEECLTTVFTNLLLAQDFKAIDQFHRLLSEEDLERLIKQLEKPFTSCQELINNMRFIYQETAPSLQSLPKHSPHFFKPLTDFIKNIFHKFMSSLTLLNIGSAGRTFFESNDMWSIFTKFFALPSCLFTSLLLFLPVTQALAITSLIVLTAVLAALVYYRFFEGTPKELSECINLSKEIRHFPPVFAHKTEMIKLARTLSQNQEGLSSKCCVIYGKPGVGKTTMARHLAYAIEKKDPHVKELWGKQVFMCSLSKIISASPFEPIRPLQRLYHEIGKHQNEVIVFFDEIHLAFPKPGENNANPALGEQFKQLFDISSGNSLKYCVGLTTDADYKNSIASNNTLYGRRVEALEVQETSQQSTVAILKDMGEFLGIEVEQEAAEEIYRLASQKKNRQQPDASIDLLLTSYKHLKRKQEGVYLRESIDSKRQEIEQKKRAFHSDQQAGENFFSEEFAICKKEIEALAAQIKIEEEHFKALQKQRSQFLSIEEFRKTQQELLKQIIKGSALSTIDRKKLLSAKYFLTPVFQRIKFHFVEQGFPIMLTRDIANPEPENDIEIQ